jgi:hypothetical protein
MVTQQADGLFSIYQDGHGEGLYDLTLEEIITLRAEIVKGVLVNVTKENSGEI